MNKKLVAIIQARYNSSRLPGKVLKPIKGISFLELQIRRLKHSEKIDDIILAFPDNNSSEPLIKLANKIKVSYILGNEENLLSRYKKAAIKTNADFIVRITSDCPLISPNILDKMANLILNNNYDIITNVLPPSWPDGLDLNVFNKKILFEACNNAVLKSDKEHVVPWMWRNSQLQKCKKFKGYNYKSTKDYSSMRWTLDSQSDFLFFKKLSLYLSLKELETMSFEDFISFFKKNKNLVKINADNIRDSGYTKSQSLDHENY